MDINFILAFILIVLAGICNAITDILRNHFATSVFKNLNPIYWDGSISWINKWVDGDKTKGRTHWFILGIKVVKPVILTDAWHLFKSIMLWCFAIAFGLLTPYFLGTFAFGFAWFLGFNTTYGFGKSFT